MADREPGRVQSVCKAMDLLSCLAEARTPMTLGELSRRTGMPKATVHGLLSALRSGVLRVSAAELERELERTNGEIAAVLRRLREEARHAAGQESPLRALDPKSNPDKEEPI